MANLRKPTLIVLAALVVLGGTAQSDDIDVATIQRGKRAFQICANCHTIDQDGAHLLGPNLYGVYGRSIASQPDFAYSDALQAKDGKWDEHSLNRYIARPKLAAPGNDMAFGGITSPHARKDLIAWLKSNPGDYNAEDSDLHSLIEQADTGRGQDIATTCLACHAAGPGMPHRIGPNLWGVVGRNVASAPGFDYSARLMRREGTWTPETLNAFIFEVKPFDQGTHMAFLKLAKKEDRAAIIKWLQSLRDDTNSD